MLAPVLDLTKSHDIIKKEYSPSLIIARMKHKADFKA